MTEIPFFSKAEINSLTIRAIPSDGTVLFSMFWLSKVLKRLSIEGIKSLTRFSLPYNLALASSFWEILLKFCSSA